jgi:hypothetical protein
VIEEVMALNIDSQQKYQVLELLNSMGVNTIYKPDAIAKRFNDIGIPVSVDANDSSLVIDGQKVTLIEPDWGSRGLYAPDILRAILRIQNLDFTSDMTGSGFYFRDLLTQLADFWNIDKSYI